MIKLFTLFNVVGLLLFNVLFGGDVAILQNLPARMDPSTEIRVDVTINKQQISGFAKLQIDLPAGLTATAIETKGASFTFADGKAKFIWMALPSQTSFKVSYTLTADASASGILPVTARLSYIQDNERKTVDMAPATITVGSGAAMASVPATKKEEPVAAAPVPAEASVALPEPTPATAANSDAPPAFASPVANTPVQATSGPIVGTRSITEAGPSEVLVTVTIKKGMLRGFGKLQETLPEGFTATAKATDDAIFSASGRVVKFVWLNLPSKSDLTVSYRLIAPSHATGAYTVNGEFGYLVNDNSQRAAIGSSPFAISGQSVAVNTPQPTTTPEPVHEKTTPKTNNAPEPAINTPPATSTEAKHNTKPARSTPVTATTVPAPETGITFKVQITAAHREVGKPYFEERHHYSGDFSIERHEGWIKYVTGLFDRYKAARDQRQAFVDANYNFPGPFVTAYNNGERITVQEALMIAGQQSAQ